MNTNPSISADIANVNNGVIVTVRSEAGKIPPYFRTTKEKRLIFKDWKSRDFTGDNDRNDNHWNKGTN